MWGNLHYCTEVLNILQLHNIISYDTLTLPHTFTIKIPQWETMKARREWSEIFSVEKENPKLRILYSMKLFLKSIGIKTLSDAHQRMTVLKENV